VGKGGGIEFVESGDGGADKVELCGSDCGEVPRAAKGGGEELLCEYLRVCLVGCMTRL